MAREKICRRVCFAPDNRRFWPEVEGGGSVTLTLDELEAIRLMDLEQGSQAECAQRMGVSRGTFPLLRPLQGGGGPDPGQGHLSGGR